MKIRPRFIAKFLAWIGGYFWLPCPLCGEYFAGFEWKCRYTIPDLNIKTLEHGICSWCEDTINRGRIDISTFRYDPETKKIVDIEEVQNVEKR